MKIFYPSSAQLIPFLTYYPEGIQKIVNTLRNELKKSFPPLIEKIYLGWKAIGYTHPQAGYVAAIFPTPNQVMIAFEYSAFLTDEKQQLVFGKSQGKQVKYLPINKIDAEVLKNLRQFIEQAIAYQLLKRVSK